MQSEKENNFSGRYMNVIKAFKNCVSNYNCTKIIPLPMWEVVAGTECYQYLDTCSLQHVQVAFILNQMQGEQRKRLAKVANQSKDASIHDLQVSRV